MNKTLFVIIVVAFLVFLVWIVITVEKRVIRKIEQKASERGFTVKEIRESNNLDGENPFGEIDSWRGTSSKILGFKGERVHNKIVNVEQNGQERIYWVKVKTTSFIPSEVKWHKLDKGNNV